MPSSIRSPGAWIKRTVTSVMQTRHRVPIAEATADSHAEPARRTQRAARLHRLWHGSSLQNLIDKAGKKSAREKQLDWSSLQSFLQEFKGAVSLQSIPAQTFSGHSAGALQKGSQRDRNKLAKAIARDLVAILEQTDFKENHSAQDKLQKIIVQEKVLPVREYDRQHASPDKEVVKVIGKILKGLVADLGASRGAVRNLMYLADSMVSGTARRPHPLTYRAALGEKGESDWPIITHVQVSQARAEAGTRDISTAQSDAEGSWPYPDPLPDETGAEVDHDSEPEHAHGSPPLYDGAGKKRWPFLDEDDKDGLMPNPVAATSEMHVEGLHPWPSRLSNRSFQRADTMEGARPDHLDEGQETRQVSNRKKPEVRAASAALRVGIAASIDGGVMQKMKLSIPVGHAAPAPQVPDPVVADTREEIVTDTGAFNSSPDTVRRAAGASSSEDIEKPPRAGEGRERFPHEWATPAIRRQLSSRSVRPRDSSGTFGPGPGSASTSRGPRTPTPVQYDDAFAERGNASRDVQSALTETSESGDDPELPAEEIALLREKLTMREREIEARGRDILRMVGEHHSTLWQMHNEFLALMSRQYASVQTEAMRSTHAAVMKRQLQEMVNLVRALKSAP